MAHSKQGFKDKLVMGNREPLLIKATTRQYPDYLTWAISDLYDQARYDVSTQSKTELQSVMTGLGLEELWCHKEMDSYRKLWDNLRKSKPYGSSPEFMQMELIKKSYPFIHSGKSKTMYLSKIAKEQLAEIADGVKIDLGCIVAMAQTFGAKKMFDDIQKAGKDAIPRPIVYEMVTKEIENFDKFIRLERLYLTLKTSQDCIWYEESCSLAYG